MVEIALLAAGCTLFLAIHADYMTRHQIRENSHHFIHHCKTVMMTIIHVVKILNDDEKLIRNMDVMVSIGMSYSTNFYTELLETY
jgi:hypothetical protein